MAAGDRLVVIGGGMVAWRLCRQLVAHGLHRERRISVIGDEPRPAYDRIRLSECLDGTAPEALTLDPREWYGDHGIDLVLGVKANALEPERNLVHTTAGERGYAQAVLATGARPFLPPIPGADLPGVFTYRGLDDVVAIDGLAQRGRRAVIVGGGLLGLELAKGLADRGLTVCILERSPGLMVRQLNPVASGILQAQVEQLGITVHVDVRVEEIVRDDSGTLMVRTAERVAHPGEVVVIAAGVRPRDELARAAGLTCSPAGGVVIDRFLRTSVPTIYAIGDCVSFGSTTFGLAAPGYHMADILARRLAGERDAEFTGYDQGTRLKLAGLEVCTVGDYLADGTTASWRRAADYRQVVLRDGRLVGATTIGGWQEQPQVSDAVVRRMTFDVRRLRAFERRGELFGGGGGVLTWPTTAVVCSCMRVTRGRLDAARTAGCGSVDDLTRVTGAGGVCGSCRPLLATLVGSDPSAEPAPKGTPVLVACSLAALVLVGLALVWDIPRATSYAELGWLERLWRDGTAKQVTGWSMLGLAALSCLFSLRKRLPALRQLGDVGRWRAVHAVVALVAAGGLVLHTGFRLGQNLDRWLAIGFAVVLALGAVAGLIVGAERAAESSLIRRARVWSLRLHLGAVSLLVPLAAFHVIKVYRW